MDRVELQARFLKFKEYQLRQISKKELVARLPYRDEAEKVTVLISLDVIEKYSLLVLSIDAGHAHIKNLTVPSEKSMVCRNSDLDRFLVFENVVIYGVSKRNNLINSFRLYFYPAPDSQSPIYSFLISGTAMQDVSYEKDWFATRNR